MLGAEPPSLPVAREPVPVCVAPVVSLQPLFTSSDRFWSQTRSFSMRYCCWRSSPPRLWLGQQVKPPCLGDDGVEVGLVPKWVSAWSP